MVQEGLAAAQLRVIVLEVGKGAVGAVAPLLADSEWLSGAFALHHLEHAVKVLALPGEPRSLEHIGQALLARAGADLLVAVQGAQEATDPDGVTVRFDATMLVVGTSKTDARETLRATQSWKTASSEVPRLLGLAALNLLRRYLGQSTEKSS